MDNYNVVGDIAGNELTLKALLAKMPQDATLISLGDPNDRGPRSKQVIEYLMSNGITVNSNHAHLMVEAYEQSKNPGVKPRYYEKGIWFYNGAIATMDSYDKNWKDILRFQTETLHFETTLDFNESKLYELIPASHIAFLKNCPMYYKSDNFIMTHAPVMHRFNLDNANDLGWGFATFQDDMVSRCSLLWNRYVPDTVQPQLEGRVNVFGHNSSDKVKVYTTQYPKGIKVDQEKLTELWSSRSEHPVFAICLDTSSAKVLTGLHLASMTLYEQEYID